MGEELKKNNLLGETSVKEREIYSVSNYLPTIYLIITKEKNNKSPGGYILAL